jgi:LysR family hydrogen peroxide-inducible transcriptional activator
MVWRRSSAMGAFLERLAQVFRELPADLFAASPPAAAPGRKRGTATRAPIRSKHG